MAISVSLIAKGIAGTLALAAPVATSVFYKDSIYGLFVSGEESAKQESRGNGVLTGSKPENFNWTIEESGEKIKITSDKKECSFSITNTGETPNKQDIIKKLEEKLEEKLGKTTASKEDHRRYRNGIIKKCGNGTELPSLNITSSNIDLSVLFDLSKETLNKQEEELVNGEWNFSVDETQEQSTTVEVTVTAAVSESDVSVKTCTIIGSKKDGSSEEINAEHLKNSRSEIKTNIEQEIKKEGNKKKFLTKCKKSFDNKIKVDLKKKEGEDKYEIEDLNLMFS